MFTERDVLRRVVGEKKNPATTKVNDVMTMRCDLLRVRRADMDDISAIMKDKRVRHLPVCDRDGDLLGYDFNR